MDGKLVLKHIETGKIIEMDFDTNKNLTKNEIKKNIENKIKSDTTMSEENKETETKTEDKTDLTEDSKKEIDGQVVDTPAEGDDDDIEGKIKGDPYQDDDKKKGERFTKKKDDMEETFTMKEVQDLINKTMKGTLEPLQKDLSDYRKDKEAKDTKEAKNILDLLQVEPYKLPFETIKDLTLEQLRTRKDVYDQLPMVQDFVSENKHITHEDVNKYAFDMNPERTDFRDDALQGALNKFKKDHGEERYKNDFGGAM